MPQAYARWPPVRSAARTAGPFESAISGDNLLEEKLNKVLRTPAVLLIGINGVIGGGIFLLPGEVARLAGAGAVWAYLVAGVIVTFVGLSFAEVSSMYSRTGGAMVYTEAAMGRTAAFSVGWMAWLTYVSGWAALSNGFVTYLAALLPVLEPYSDPIIVTVVAALCLLNAYGVRRGANTIAFFTVAKVLPLLLLVTVGLLHSASPVASGATPVAHGFGKAVLMLVFAYGGFEMATVPAGEMTNPRKTIAIVVIGTLVVVTALYMLIQYAVMRLDPGIASAKNPLASAGARMFGGGAVVMTIGAALSILGTKSGVALVAPRQLYALGQDGFLPRWFGHLDAKRKTPVVAIWITGGLVMLAAATGTFTTLILLNVAARLFEYTAVCLSAVILRFRARHAERFFRLPFGITIPTLATFLCITLLTRESARELWAAFVALAVGLLWYLFNQWPRTMKAR